MMKRQYHKGSRPKIKLSTGLRNGSKNSRKASVPGHLHEFAALAQYPMERERNISARFDRRILM